VYNRIVKQQEMVMRDVQKLADAVKDLNAKVDSVGRRLADAIDPNGGAKIREETKHWDAKIEDLTKKFLEAKKMFQKTGDEKYQTEMRALGKQETEARSNRLWNRDRR
jgi:uncharacterized protein YoxC